MEDKRSQVVGGSCLGGLIGGLVGVVVGGVIASSSIETNKTGTAFDLLDVCFAPFALAFGAGIGGIVGAIAGSAFGAGIAAKGNGAKATAPMGSRSEPTPSGVPPTPISTETELAQLRERI